jgi:hypothetical protein
MKKIHNVLAVIILLLYWIPASMLLYDIIKDDGVLFPYWIEKLLLPGYFLGFVLGFGGGNLAAFIGQIITLIILFFIFRGLIKSFNL